MRAIVIQVALAFGGAMHLIAGEPHQASSYLAGALVVWALRQKKEGRAMDRFNRDFERTRRALRVMFVVTLVVAAGTIAGAVLLGIRAYQALSHFTGG